MVYLKSRWAAFVRSRRGELTQQAFAKKVGVAQSTIMRIENESHNVTLDTLEKLCGVFKCDIGELFNSTTPISSPLRHIAGKPGRVGER